MRIPVSRIFAPPLFLTTAHWRIQRRAITIEFGNAERGKQLGFGGR